MVVWKAKVWQVFGRPPQLRVDTESAQVVRWIDPWVAWTWISRVDKDAGHGMNVGVVKRRRRAQQRVWEESAQKGE